MPNVTPQKIHNDDFQNGRFQRLIRTTFVNDV